MRLTHYSLILVVTLAAIQNIALAQGQPDGAKPADDAAAGHRHHNPGNGSMTAAPAVAQPEAGRGSQGGRQGREWTKYPLITPMMGRPGDRAAATLAVNNLQPAELEVFAAEGPADSLHRRIPVDPSGTRIEAVTPKIGNYHWVSAREEAAGAVTVATTTYPFGNPGEAPTRMLLQKKNELEIIPQPLPREHGAWRESEKWDFLLRFNGQPLANKTVKMETEFGTRTAFVSDEKGRVTVLFPRDFKPAEKKPEAGGHDHGPRRAKFVLAAEHDDGGRHYLTAFNYTYSADAERGKSLLAGVAFGVFGMLLAAPLLRRKKVENNNNVKEA